MLFNGSKRDKMSKHNSDAKISFLRRELDMALARSDSLERENRELKHEVNQLKSQVSALKSVGNEKTMLWKKFDDADKNSQYEIPTNRPMLENTKKPKEEFKKPEVEMRKPLELPKLQPLKAIDSTYLQKLQDSKVPPAVNVPPPPPPPASNLLLRSKAIRRVPELVEFYRLLMKRETQTENRSSTQGTHPVINPKNMIGEIENRSTHVLAVKSDVETQGDLINSLAKAVETTTFEDISQVEVYVKWLDRELSKLVDERAVLRHFPQWPEKKADALREAAFSYRDLKTLETEVLLIKDDPKQPFSQSLRRMQTLLDRLEQSVNNMERIREGTIKRYAGFHIPSQWMQDNALLGQMKLSSLTLVKACMKRVKKELEFNELSQEDVLLQGVRFAFRVHQFAGGFDAETKQVFDEVRKIESNRKQ